ncbi:MAG: patatin-like phospholipase family protein [Deltaproteobacteria bacterium]|nr:patatin-like phospholipase family protein [Candidatus Zymogenaceae bacterium]
MARTAGEKGLTLLAGPQALDLIRDGGLSAASVQTILGAAGGPKWLVLVGLDRAIFFSWLSRPATPVELIGSSIGAWRFAAVAQGSRAANAHEALREAYTCQTYDEKPSPADITDEAARILDEYLTDDGVRSILANPSFYLSVLSVRGRGSFSTDKRSVVATGMFLAGTANVFSRNNLGLFFVRVVFSDPRNGGPGSTATAFMDGPIPSQRVALTADNLRAAILASGSIPMVMTPTVDISGAPDGYYWDGGLVDYHVTIPDSPGVRSDGIVLFPHYTDRIIPGWLDKHLPWRAPNPADLGRTLLVAPSREFVARLPYGKIPDRGDFKRFYKNDRERIAYWERTTAEGLRLGDEFLELVESGKIREKVRAFSAPGT